MGTLLLAAALVAYNNLANLWPPFNRAAYVPMNVVVAAGLVAISLGPLGITPDELGIDRLTIADFALGVGIGTGLAAPAFVAVAMPATRHIVRDNRVRHLSPGGLAYQALVRVPLGTALVEEIAFRGVLLGAWDDGDFVAAALSSIAFALWHVTPTINMMSANRPHARRKTIALAIAATIAITFTAGLVLGLLRRSTGGLAAPFGLHAALNGLATVAAWLAHRPRAR